ncbi:hypothetical protein Ocin01_08203 [Orchesella cincta]|uniref:Uncharacterized protein n=1 Tax=Orchesella cincta TaxID=48709 RepID=A0A1D2MZL0_ORCCI|nr:hypothetical protein Ocin01_08203 [Orchesella cincta]
MNKVQNRSKRSPLQQTFLFQPYANVFKMIRNSMRKDPSQLPQEERLKSQIVSQTRLHVFDIERKSVCISEIVKTCEIFLASFHLAFIFYLS